MVLYALLSFFKYFHVPHEKMGLRLNLENKNLMDSKHEHHNIMGMWVEGKQHDMKEEHRIIGSFNITFPNISQTEKSKTFTQRKLLLLILKRKISNNMSCCCSINFEISRYQQNKKRQVLTCYHNRVAAMSANSEASIGKLKFRYA